jgi:cyclophilin family peptidyl-prolyl cis-trans isomerase
LSASLAPIPGLTVPAQLGGQVVLDGSGNTDPAQTDQAVSDNPDIQVSVARGPYWTITVSHQASSTPGDVSFTNAPMTFQLFQDLTPDTVARITNFTNSGYYVNTGKFFPRILQGFVAQGGSNSATSTASSSGVPPIATEIVQQLNFSGTAQLAMANTGAPVSTDAQFFVTFGPQTSIDFGYTIVGQLVSGQSTLTDLSLVTVHLNGSAPPEVSVPVSPIVITSATLSTTSVNGVLHVDATSARAGESARITVTATDPTDGSQAVRNFTVTVGAYNGPTSAAAVPINFVPLADPVATTTQPSTSVAVQLQGRSGFPDPASPGSLTYQLLSQPAHGTISSFDPATGKLVYTPAPGFAGTETFQYLVQATGPNATPATTTSRPATVSIVVGQPLVTVTGIQEVFDPALRLTGIVVRFSGPLNGTRAARLGIYRLALANGRGSYTARNSPILRIRRATYSKLDNTVTLRLRTPLVLSRTAQLQIAGSGPRGLIDTRGRLIDGDRNGIAGGNAILYV